MKQIKLDNSLIPVPVTLDRKAGQHRQQHAMEAAVRHLNMVMLGISALVFGIWYSLL